MRFRCLAVVLACAVWTPLAPAAPVFPALGPGEVYRLAFISSTTGDATSTDIADYNATVTALANAVPELAALGADWFVIGSTATVDAIDNIGASSPGVGIYNLIGEKIADGTADLCDGSLQHQINADENADSGIVAFAWTGSSSVCTASSHPLGAAQVNLGFDVALDADWIDFLGGTSATNDEAYHLYAISSELTYAPEPGSMVLMALGLGLLAARRRFLMQRG